MERAGPTLEDKVHVASYLGWCGVGVWGGRCSIHSRTLLRELAFPCWHRRGIDVWVGMGCEEGGVLGVGDRARHFRFSLL